MTTKTKPKFDIYQEVTNTVIELIESGLLGRWQKGWNTNNATSKDLGMGDLFSPYNLETDKPYNGVNILLLANAMVQNKYKHNVWLTFKQAQKLGYKVVKGSKSEMVTFWKIYKKDVKNEKTGEKEEKDIFILKYYRVFNVEQLENFDLSGLRVVEPQEFNENPEALQIYANASGKISLSHKGTRAFYAPSLDVINMPHKAMFNSEQSYLAVYFHELNHATGHKSRLNRHQTAGKNTQEYAKEELIAELGSAFLMAKLNVKGAELLNHASYLKSWLQLLKDDKKAIISASSQAQKACDYILEHWGGTDEGLKMVA